MNEAPRWQNSGYVNNNQKICLGVRKINTKTNEKLAINTNLVLEILIIGVFASVVCFMNLASYPRWYADEGTNMVIGLNLFQGHLGYQTWGPNFFPPLFDFLIGLSLKLLGVNYFAARLPSAIMGILSAILMYFIGRRLYGRFIGVSSALLLSIAGSYINRMALSYTAIEFFFLLCVFFYLRLFDTGGKKWSYLVGVSAGLALLSSYMGIVVFIFVFFQSLIDKRLRQIKYALITFSVLFLVYPLLGIIFSWKWFIYDVLFQASRGMDPQNLLYVITLDAPYNRQGFLPPFYWTLIGFVACFYIIARRSPEDNSWSNKLASTMLFSVLTVFVLSTSLWWSSLIVIYPVYSLAISILILDIYRNRASFVAVLLISIVLLPSLLINASINYPFLARYSIFYYAVIIFVFLACLAKEKILSTGFLRKFKALNCGNIQAKALFIIVVLIFSGLVAFVDFPNLRSNATSDQVAVVNYLNFHTVKTDMVAANPDITSLFSCIGIDYAQVAFYTIKQPMFLYDNVGIMISRFSMNVSLNNMKYIIFDSSWKGATSNAQGVWVGENLTDSVESSWWNVFDVGDYSVYLNPRDISLSDLNLISGWNDTLFNEGWSLAYFNGTSPGNVTSNGTTGFFATNTTAVAWPDYYAFWEKDIGNISLTEYPSLIIQYKVNDPNVQIVVKMLNAQGNEVGGWFTDSSPSTDNKFSIYTPTARSVSTIIVGMDDFGDTNTQYVLSIDMIGFYSVSIK